MAGQVVRLNANLQPEVATALDDLATRIGGNKTTALHQAILLADLLYREADDRGTIQVKKVGSTPRTVVLPKIDPNLADRIVGELRADAAPIQAQNQPASAAAPTSAAAPAAAEQVPTAVDDGSVTGQPTALG